MRTCDRAGHWRWLGVLVCAALNLVAGCNRPRGDVVQGYVEGEFVYVSSPLAGALESLFVQRGSQVNVGDSLFSLECGAETAAQAQAAKRLEEGRARLDDAKKGKRPPEIEAIEAQLKQSRAALELSEKEFERQSNLFRSGAASPQELDRARSARDQDRQRVSQLDADLDTAQLGSRSDQIAAAEANVRALEAALARADWDLSQKRQSCSADWLGFRHALPPRRMGGGGPAGGRAPAAGEYQGARLRAGDARRHDSCRRPLCALSSMA